MILMLLRRLPGLIYTYRYPLYSAFILLATLIYFLFRWNLFCSNIQAWQHVNKICTLYEEGYARGLLCDPLCTTKTIHSITCHSFRSTKEAVFSAELLDDGSRMVFKSAATSTDNLITKPIHWYDNGIAKYPTEKEFLATIRTVVRNKLNLTLGYEELVRLGRMLVTTSPSSNIDIEERQKDMDNLWILLQDNEYLLTVTYNDRNVFPRLIGTCGPYFAVEYMEPIPRDVTSMLTLSDSRADWGRRLKISVQILELLDELDTGFREPFHLCDIKLQHFGLSTAAATKMNSDPKLKFIDLSGVYPRSIINRIIGENGDRCVSDDDCDFLDCRARCHTKTGKCMGSVSNNNLQIVCEKIFLGWRRANTVIVPGLLMSQHTPADLAALLRQCANPHGEVGKARVSPADEVQKRLYSVLGEIEQSVNNDFFL